MSQILVNERKHNIAYSSSYKGMAESLQNTQKRQKLDIHCIEIRTAVAGLLLLEKLSDSNASSTKYIIQSQLCMRSARVGKRDFRIDISPEDYFIGIIKSRGYGCHLFKTSSVERNLFKVPTAKQVTDYDIVLGEAIRKSSLEDLKHLVKEGRSLDARNKFGESLTHLACRKGNVEVVKLILEHGGSLLHSDDLGRVPLHDACWASEPSWDIIRLNIEVDDSLLLTADKRGWTPLRYINRSKWYLWRNFFDQVKDHYWPPTTE